MPEDITRRAIYKDAVLLEQYCYKSEGMIAKRWRGLWKDIEADAGAVCDGIIDAFYIPREASQAKENAVAYAMSHIMRMERRLNIANAYDVQALCNEQKAKYDILTHKVKGNLSAWLNSLHRLNMRQIPQPTDCGENWRKEDSEHAKTYSDE